MILGKVTCPNIEQIFWPSGHPADDDADWSNYEMGEQNFMTEEAVQALGINAAKLCLKKWPTPVSFSFIFIFSKQNNSLFTAKHCEKMSCPSSIRHRDLNPWPLEHESSPITTRSGFSPKQSFFEEAQNYFVFPYVWGTILSIEGRSPDLVAIGGDSCSRGCEFEAQLLILDDYFYVKFLCKKYRK